MTTDTVKSAARALQILEYFDTVKRASTVAEVGDHYGWPSSSTSALMRSLVLLGYLHYESGARTYYPSMRVALLGDWLHDSMLFQGKLSQLLERLNSATGETVVLAGQNGLYSQYLRVLPGSNVLSMQIPIGTLRPLLTSGTGRMLLTRMDNGAIRKLARKYNLDNVATNVVDIEQLLSQIMQDRARGYAVSINGITPHATMFAMLLPSRPGEKPLAIGIGGLTDRLINNEANYIKIMADAVNEQIGKIM
jgi:DNA-binding IclR family transcriptional regulator